jgi:hypothetical protein
VESGHGKSDKKPAALAQRKTVGSSGDCYLNQANAASFIRLM